MTTVARGGYDAVAGLCATALVRMPMLEAPFVAAGRRLWRWRRPARLYRSVVGRYADRLRSAGREFRTLAVGGRALALDVTEFTTLPMYFGGITYEPQTTEFVRAHLAPGDVFVDVGANHGYFTLLAAALVGERGGVFSFEPNPDTRARLAVHVARNGFESRVTVESAALCDTAGSGRLYLSRWPANSGITSLTPSPENLADGGLSPEHTIDVDTDTFDAWRAGRKVGRIAIVKMDAEGAEDLIVRGMCASLRAGAVDAVVCETRGDSEAHRTLLSHGFAATMLEQNGPLTNIGYVRPR